MGAIRNYAGIKAIPARIVNEDNHQPRRISANENFVRENLYAIETIEAIVEIMDTELNGDKEYASMGKNLSGKLDSVRASETPRPKVGAS